MNPFIVLHHYPHQNKNINVSMSLNSYITHHSGAGSRDLPPCTGGPPDQALNQLACEIFSGNNAYHNYCQIRNGHCDCFTITILKKNTLLLTISISHAQWISLPPTATTTATHPSLPSSPTPAPSD